ncbi:MAG: flagellar hook-associated protein FlgK [Deltaproteobacteria bacterium]|jgi:flagellar hook-associated protein 1 FlgK
MSSGIGMVLSIAKDALAAQQYGINVTGHNIANVNTPGYSRQSPVLEAKQPELYGGVLLGRGVDTTQVLRVSDQVLESRLMQEKSDMFSFKEMESYMQVFEGLFNENSESSLSGLIGDFWNLWHDLANNPSGTPERIALYEHSVLLCQQFNALDGELSQLNTDLTNALGGGIEKINEITAEIARLNNEIAGQEVDGIANDLRDQRNTLASELAEYIDMKIFEQSNGSYTIVSAKGCVLVNQNESYDLELNGTAVEWHGSGSTTVDITNYITNGKLGGWLDMRDEVVAKYQGDLSALAEELIWTLNQQHSQGVGLTAFSSITGSYDVSDTGEALGTVDSGLDYYDKVSDGTFNVWVYDSNGDVSGSAVITVDADPGGTTLASIAADINAIADISASITTDNKLQIDAASGFTVAFSDDTSNVLAGLGINTFFQGATAGGMGVNDFIRSSKDHIAAAQIDASGNFASGDNTNALAMTDLQFASRSIGLWSCDRREGNTEGTTTATIEDYYHAMVGSIGIKAASISSSRAFNEVMVNELKTMRESISGVSLDEEMTELIRFQNAFAAAAKLISVADEMFDTLISVK